MSMANDFDELIRTGQIDITTREAVENDTDREARAAEPGAYALTYEEAITVLRANNIIDTVMIQNNFVSVDPTTRTRIFSFNPESTQIIIDAFEQRGIDPDDLYSLSERVLSSNWYTLMLSSQYAPGKENGPGKYLYANVNGKRDEGILRIEDYPAVYDGSSRSDQREALKLPKDAGFLFSAELDILTTLRQVCDPQTFIEEKVGYLAPYSMMPNSPAFHLVDRVFNNPLIRQNGVTPLESLRIEVGDTQNELKIIASTRNVTSTITISDCEQFFDTANGKKRRVAMSGVKKVWRFSLSKLIQQSAFNKAPSVILIDLQEMVDLKMYTTHDTAYRGIATMLKKACLILIGQDYHGRKKKKQDDGVLFFHSSRLGSQAQIFVNQQFDFEIYKDQYTYFPNWGYALDGNSFALAEYIFQQIRQNAIPLTEKGKFRMKLSTVCEHLAFPTVEEVHAKRNSRYNDYIKKPILQAVTDINAAAKADKDIEGYFKIAVKADAKTIESWLAGYIEITANGEYTDYLKGIATTRRIFDSTYKEEKTRIAAKRAARSKSKPKKSVEKNPTPTSNGENPTSNGENPTSNGDAKP